MIEATELPSAEQQVLAELGTRIKIFRFNPKPSGQSFYRTTLTGKWAFHISFIKHKGDFDLTADVAVRIDKIEDLVNEYDAKRTSAEKRKSMTLGGELGNLSVGRPLRWSVASVSDIPTICDQVLEAFGKIGLPFLESCSEVAGAYRILRSSDPKELHLAPFPGPRYMRALAAAYLLESDVKERTLLANEYEKNLLENDDLYLDDFRALSLALPAVTS
ncbi:hypothetical protein [Granulicella mallensis]|uniref:Uncharacterized protein n=1 Tax=Granulicella mallensis TaxID=940614 RepID=A0A7W8EBL4_9BACT|nr:hypothetical protein [Granulicella mallensis]MBB5064655.1 hypothetical protein [Granulicella mallensis]